MLRFVLPGYTLVLIFMFSVTALAEEKAKPAKRCMVRVLTNDPLSTIVVNDKKIKSNMTVFRCDEEEQMVMVISSDGRKQKRFIPKRSEIPGEAIRINFMFSGDYVRHRGPASHPRAPNSNPRRVLLISPEEMMYRGKLHRLLENKSMR
jgi:hypothetical protein